MRDLLNFLSSAYPENGNINLLRNYPNIYQSARYHTPGYLVNLPLYRPGRPLRIQEVETPRISRLSAHKVGKVVSPTHRSPLPPRRHPWYSFLLQAESKQVL